MDQQTPSSQSDGRHPAAIDCPTLSPEPYDAIPDRGDIVSAGRCADCGGVSYLTNVGDVSCEEGCAGGHILDFSKDDLIPDAIDPEDSQTWMYGNWNHDHHKGPRVSAEIISMSHPGSPVTDRNFLIRTDRTDTDNWEVTDPSRGGPHVLAVAPTRELLLPKIRDITAGWAAIARVKWRDDINPSARKRTIKAACDLAESHCPEPLQ